MRSGERRDVALLFSGLDLLPVTDAIARQAGAWLRAHRRSHPGVDLVDYLVAATAWHHGLRLLTLDVKHFPMFPGSASAWQGRVAPGDV
jgi:predicted nucleic acid-binding protein